MADGPRAPSRTAALTAVARAMHREEPPPLVLDDPFAMDLAGPEGPLLKARLLEDVPPTARLAFSRWIVVRARYTEDVLERKVGEGIHQYVSLGAGLDSFAYRRPELMERLTVFEVDHPGTQAWKRARLEAMGLATPAGLVYVPVNFERETLRDGLAAAHFDFQRPAVFSWIGVTMYLTIEAIEATLRVIRASAPGTTAVLTYNQPLQDVGSPAAAAMGAQLGAIATDLGEPIISRFTPREIEAVLARLGFAAIAHFGAAEAVKAYYAGRSDVVIYDNQRIATATV